MGVSYFSTPLGRKSVVLSSREGFVCGEYRYFLLLFADSADILAFMQTNSRALMFRPGKWLNNFVIFFYHSLVFICLDVGFVFLGSGSGKEVLSTGLAESAVIVIAILHYLLGDIGL